LGEREGVTHDDADLHDEQQGDEDDRQRERSFDRRLATLS
jgi:hypothetical protein